MKNYNFLWVIIWIITTFLNYKNYTKYKNFAIKKTLKHIETQKTQKNLFFEFDKKYNNIENCLYDLPLFLKKTLIFMKKSPNFTLLQKKVSNVEISQMSKKYDFLFDCRGSQTNSTFLCENVGGYKITVKTNHPLKKTCFSLENGWFIHSDLNNPRLLIIKGGMIIGTKTYETDLITTLEKQKIAKILKRKPFWQKYHCGEILEIRKGTRQMSIDLLPFYKVHKNVISVHGGSMTGAILSPYVSSQIIDDVLYRTRSEHREYDFSVYRPIKQYIKVVLYIILLIAFCTEAQNAIR